MRRTVDVTAGLTVSWNDGDQDPDEYTDISWSATKPGTLKDLIAESHREYQRVDQRLRDLYDAEWALRLALKRELEAQP